MTTPPTRPEPEPRDGYVHFTPLTTRWMDNDAYGHLNNTVYYSFFDTALNQYLIESGALDIQRSEVIGLVVQTHCDFFASVEYPQAIEVGLRVAHRGTSSVRYEMGLFVAGAPMTAARGHFVHVYVDRTTRRPVPLTPELSRVTNALVPR